MARPIEKKGDIIIIPLTKGYSAIADASSLHLLEGYYWTAAVRSTVVYAYRNHRRGDGTVKTIFMHQAILGARQGQIVDHKDHDGLNNRKDNLRICDHSKNSRNTRLRSNNTSGYKGVSWNKRQKKWRAGIKANGKQISLGCFHTPEEAAKAYERASEIYHEGYGHVPKSHRHERKQ